MKNEKKKKKENIPNKMESNDTEIVVNALALMDVGVESFLREDRLRYFRDDLDYLVKYITNA